MYVANRIQAIRNVSDSSQWRYIESENNPVDLATRCMSPDKLMDSRWMTGPEAKILKYSPQHEKKSLPKESNLLRLDPFVDADGLLRVGRGLRNSSLVYHEKDLLLLPRRHHMSMLITRHFHENVFHQGRQITHGAIREAGFWVIGAHRMIAKLIEGCVTCRKLRGTTLTQMANLPSERTETTPPFTNVGFDVFGPWEISTRKLRGDAVNSKR